MELVRERQTTELTNAELEAQRHNAQISERYRKLLSAEADQFAADVYEEKRTEEVRASVIAPEAPVYVSPVTSETPVVEQVPQVTEFVHERVTASVFTPEKFDRIQEFRTVNNAATAEVVAPTYVANVFEATPAVKPMEEAQYSLSPLAKRVMAIAAVATVAMFSLVGINSQIIHRKTARLQNLQQQKQELVEQYEELQKDIETATSEDTIRAWAESQLKN